MPFFQKKNKYENKINSPHYLKRIFMAKYIIFLVFWDSFSLESLGSLKSCFKSMNGNVFWNTVCVYFLTGSGTRQGGGYVSRAPRRWISVSWVWTCVPLRRADGWEWPTNPSHRMGKADAHPHRGLRTQADTECGRWCSASETTTPFTNPTAFYFITDFLLSRMCQPNALT